MNTPILPQPLRHPQSPSHRLIHETYWKGFQLMPGKAPFLESYLESILQVMNSSTACYSSSMVVLVTLKFPTEFPAKDTSGHCMTRFIAALYSQIRNDLLHRERNLECKLHYIWCRERDSAPKEHFHVALFFNRQAYHTLGRWWDSSQLTPYTLPSELSPRNTAQRIQQAWASAIGMYVPDIGGLVHFHDQGVFTLINSDEDFYYHFESLFKRLSYFAKDNTKHYGDRQRSFGASHASVEAVLSNSDFE